MIKLKSLLLQEYISEPVLVLKKYLTISNFQEKEDLIYHEPQLILKWANESDVITEKLKQYIINNEESLYNSDEIIKYIKD